MLPPSPHRLRSLSAAPQRTSRTIDNAKRFAMRGPPLGDNLLGIQRPNLDEKSQGLRRRSVVPPVDEKKSAPDGEKYDEKLSTHESDSETQKLSVHESDSETLVGDDDDEGAEPEIAPRQTSRRSKPRATATATPSPDAGGNTGPSKPWWSKLAALLTGALQSLLQTFLHFANKVHDWIFGDYTIPDWEKELENEAEKTKAQQNQIIDNLKDEYKKEAQKLPEPNRAPAASYFARCMSLIRSFWSSVGEMMRIAKDWVCALPNVAWSKLQQTWVDLKAACQPIIEKIRSFFVGPDPGSCPSGSGALV